MITYDGVSTSGVFGEDPCGTPPAPWDPMQPYGTPPASWDPMHVCGTPPTPWYPTPQVQPKDSFRLTIPVGAGLYSTREGGSPVTKNGVTFYYKVVTSADSDPVWRAYTSSQALPCTC